MKASPRKIVGSIAILMFSFVLIMNPNLTYASSQNISVDSDNDRIKNIHDMFRDDLTNPTQILKYQLLLDGLDETQTQPIVKQTVKQDVLDDVRDFYIINSFYDEPYVYVQRTAKMLAIGDHCYVYVLNSLIDSQGLSGATLVAENWRNEFENKIYPNDILYFGNPDGNLGDIDGDYNVTILLASLDAGVAGYFDPNNEYPGPNSNQREMVYVDYFTTYGVLAHEFQHLIHYNYDTAEFWWLDEGCAELAKYLNGYDTTNNLTSFASSYFATNPDDSLLYWNYNEAGGKNVRIDYGGAYMFVFYMAEKYGNAAIKDMVASTSVGPVSVETALQGLGHSIDFNDLYLNWITALYIDDPSFGGGLYGYENLDISMSYNLVSTFPASLTDRLNRFYGIYALKLDSPPDVQMLEITPPSSYSLGISIAVHNASGWTVKTSVHSTDILEFIEGTLVDTVYVITSIMTSSTPTIPSNSPITDQFGLGYSDSLDYTMVPGSPINIDSYLMDYQTSTWDFSLADVYIEDENGTEITDGSGVDVYVQFKETATSTVYTSIELNYLAISFWYVDISLQSFDEAEYSISIIASGSSQYGREDLGLLNVEHVLIVDKPTISKDDEISFHVYGNASYTQLDGWPAFTAYAEVRVIIYDDEGTVVETYDLYYISSANRWESVLIEMGDHYGEFYAAVRISYSGRTVLSSNSDIFMIEGSTPSPTNRISSPFLYGALILVIVLVIPILRRKTK
ncbi:MAG: hypothetical protein HGN29_02510 [Asgard group archaeon]|nr:hypothetical protein [Asgard group archaeon]